MTRSATFPRADTKVQSFASAFRGSPIQPNVVVLHTTEGTSWPSYSGGASAPHLTAKPNLKTKKLEWRQHFPLTMSARALRNDAGGVETNTLNCVQVELIGTCDPPNKGKSNWFFWPDAPDWALEQVGEFIAFMHEEWALKIQGVPQAKWLPYPKSYGSVNGQRMTGAKWGTFYGVCGHQHVPENSHGDPGDLDITKVLAHAKALTKPVPKTPPKAARAIKVHEIAQNVLDAAGPKTSKTKIKQWAVIRDAAADLKD